MHIVGKPQSPFAEALRGLIDGTKWLTRAQWATCLYVTEKEIEDWLTDVSLPSTEKISILFSKVEGDFGKGPRINEPFYTMLANFRDLFNLPWSEIGQFPAPTTVHTQLLPGSQVSLGDVLVDHALRALIDRIRYEPWHKKKEAIEAAHDLFASYDRIL